MIPFLNMLVSSLLLCKSRKSISQPSVSGVQRFMFSGIVEEIGTVKSIQPKSNMVSWNGSVIEGIELCVCAEKVFFDAYVGCSISVNGVCLTATSVSSQEVR